MKRAIFGLTFLTVFSFCLSAYAQDSEFVENPANHGGRIVGDWKYFGRDYIVRNPRATLPEPEGIPLVKMDSTQEECEAWTEDQRISFFELTAYSPRVAVVNDTVHVVWKQSLYTTIYHEEVCYARSTDGGITWEDSVVLSLIDGVESIRPDVAVQDNNVYVVWEDLSSMSWGGIYFRKSTDGGTTWQEIIPIALRGVDDYDYYRPTMVVKDSSVFVAFAKNVEQNGMLKFKKSTDCGETWSQEIHISDRAVCGHWAKMVLNSVGLYVTYQNGLSIWCNRSIDWGDSWNEDMFISDMDSSIAQWPSIGADDNGGIYITWFDYKYSPYPWTGDIFLRKSTDNGQTWDSIMVLTDNHLCVESDVCGNKSWVHVVWRDGRHEEGNLEIYHRRSTDSGFSWEEEDRLTDAPYESTDPWLAKDRRKVYMVWRERRDYPENRSIYFKNGYWYARGDANRDGMVNLADAVYIVNYLFIGGPPPEILESGDINGDGQINMADVVYLVNFLFIGGPPPVEC